MNNQISRPNIVYQELTIFYPKVYSKEDNIFTVREMVSSIFTDGTRIGLQRSSAQDVLRIKIL